MQLKPNGEFFVREYQFLTHAIVNQSTIEPREGLLEGLDIIYLGAKRFKNVIMTTLLYDEKMLQLRSQRNSCSFKSKS